MSSLRPQIRLGQQHGYWKDQSTGTTSKPGNIMRPTTRNAGHATPCRPYWENRPIRKTMKLFVPVFIRDKPRWKMERFVKLLLLFLLRQLPFYRYLKIGNSKYKIILIRYIVPFLKKFTISIGIIPFGLETF